MEGKTGVLIVRATIVGLLLFSAVVSGCSKQPDCVTSDTMRKMTQVEGARHLYLRVSGFQEKEHFYELYDQEPAFDACGAADVAPLAVAHVDSAQGVPDSLSVHETALEIRYREGDTFSEAGLVGVEVVND